MLKIKHTRKKHPMIHHYLVVFASFILFVCIVILISILSNNPANNSFSFDKETTIVNIQPVTLSLPSTIFVESTKFNLSKTSFSNLGFSPFYVDFLFNNSDVVGWWGFESFDESSLTLLDNSIYSYNGVLPKSAGFTQGVIGYAYNLDDGVIRFRETYNLSNGPFTISFWTLRPYFGENNAIAGQMDSSFQKKGLKVEVDIGHNGVDFTIRASDSPPNMLSATYGEFPLDNEFHHVVASWNGSYNISGLTIWIDGIQQSVKEVYQDSLTIPPVTDAIWAIGSRDSSQRGYSYTTVDEIIFFNRSLSHSEVNLLYYLKKS